MTTERAVEILDPEHREHYDSIEIVNEACWMGMEALKNPLLAFIKEEVPFRLAEIHDVPIDRQDSEMVDEMVDRLWADTDLMFNYDAIDSLIIEILKDYGFYDESTEQEYGDE